MYRLPGLLCKRFPSHFADFFRERGNSPHPTARLQWGTMHDENPYKPPQAKAAAETHQACPICSSETSCIKRFEVLDRCNFFLIMAVLHGNTITACPDCMRSILWRRCIANLLRANLLWPVYVVPRTLIQIAWTFLPADSGLHSP